MLESTGIVSWSGVMLEPSDRIWPGFVLKSRGKTGSASKLASGKRLKSALAAIRESSPFAFLARGLAMAIGTTASKRKRRICIMGTRDD